MCYRQSVHKGSRGVSTYLFTQVFEELAGKLPNVEGAHCLGEDVDGDARAEP
jgi:hypothetical protein